MFVGGQAAWSPRLRGSWVCLGMAPDTPPLPALPRPPRPCHALGVPPMGALTLSQPQGDQGMGAGREDPASCTLSAQVPADGGRGRLGLQWPRRPGRCGRMKLHGSFHGSSNSAVRALRDVGCRRTPSPSPTGDNLTCPLQPQHLCPCSCLPQGTPWYPPECHPRGQGPPTPLTPPCTPGKRG